MDDILDILVAHGVPGDVIVRVAKLIADSQVTESRRTKNRERMKSVRARAHTSMHTETQQSPPIEERKKEKEVSIGRRASRAQPKIPLPENWHPELIGKVEFERFCDHARTKGRLCVDWEAAWRNWNRNAPRFNGENHGRSGQARPKSGITTAIDGLIERLEQEEETSRIPRQTDLRMLPGGRSK